MEVIVNTTFQKIWSAKPYMAYDPIIDEYFLVLKSTRDMRRVKLLMKVAKAKIKQEIKLLKGIEPTVKFQVRSFKYYEEGI